MVDELIELDAQYRGCKTKADNLRAQRNALSKQIGVLMGQKKKEEAAQKRDVLEKSIKIEDLLLIQAEAEKIAKAEAAEALFSK